MQQDIISLGGDVYSVHDKLVYFEPGVFDLADPRHASSLSAFAKQLYEPGHSIRKGYGDDTVCRITGSAAEGAVHPTAWRMQALPQAAQDAIRRFRDARNQ